MGLANRVCELYSNPEKLITLKMIKWIISCYIFPHFRYNFQRLQAPVQPGSMDSEAGIFSITFDKAGTRMITTDADKTIKLYKQDDTAVYKLILKYSIPIK